MKPIERPERSYYDLQSLNKIKLENPQEALEQAAALFETHFLKTVLKHMRDATDAIASEESPFSSDTQRFYRDLNDEQLAQRLSGKGPFGLAHMLVKQFSQTSPQETPIAMFKSDESQVAFKHKDELVNSRVTQEGIKGHVSLSAKEGNQSKYPQ
ncbi:rod-binding protein [Enterobacter ludwigii]